MPICLRAGFARREADATAGYGMRETYARYGTPIYIHGWIEGNESGTNELWPT